MLKVQKSDTGALTLVEQLRQKVQQQNQTILQNKKRLRLLNRTSNQQSKFSQNFSLFKISQHLKKVFTQMHRNVQNVYFTF